jgi:hypothetical protein
MLTLSSPFFFFSAHLFCIPLHSPLRVVLLVFFDLCIDDHGSFVICRADSVRPKHLSDQNFDHDYYFKLLFQGAGCPIKWTTLYFTPCPSTSFPAFEPNLTNCEYCQLFRHIQYRRTASFLAMATLAILFSRRIIRCVYRRRQSGLHRAAACAASTNKKRNNALPCLLMCPSLCRPALESSPGNEPRVAADLLATRKPIRCPND